MFSFYNKRWIFIAVSVVVMLAGLVSYLVSGLNVDIDFKGGTSIVFNTKSDSATKEEIADLVKATVKTSGSVVVQPSMDNPQEYTIKLNSLTTAEADSLVNALIAKYVPTEEGYNDYGIS